MGGHGLKGMLGLFHKRLTKIDTVLKPISSMYGIDTNISTKCR